MSGVALTLSIFTFFDDRDRADKSQVEAQDERIDEIDKYARPSSAT